jgi:4-hydroxybenzoate polyprenyltransferase
VRLLYVTPSSTVLNENLTLMLGQSKMSARTTISFAINALVILSTIHAQDFRDEVGDKLMGRRTLPIVWPEASRIGILIMLTTWSVGLSWACGLASPFSVPFCALAFFIGLRFFRKRTADADKRSYRYYNVRILVTQAMRDIKAQKPFPPCLL